MTELVALTDADFDWMLGQTQGVRGLTLPAGGVDTPETLAVIRRIDAALLRAHAQGAWMVVSDREVVGLCGYLRPPYSGEVEIGYGVAVSRRNLGHATAAVGAMVAAAAGDPAVEVLVARTAVANVASQRVLTKNEFVQIALERDEEGGDVIIWKWTVR